MIHFYNKICKTDYLICKIESYVENTKVKYDDLSYQ